MSATGLLIRSEDAQRVIDELIRGTVANVRPEIKDEVLYAMMLALASASTDQDTGAAGNHLNN